MQFSKLEALGNDFVLIDNRDGTRAVALARAVEIADRRRGIGCDQVLILHEQSDAAARVEIINADGTPAEQCGNGMRAIAAWLDARGELGTAQRLQTPAGTVEVAPAADARYRADLPAPREISSADLELPPPRLPAPTRAWWLLSLGNPHLVVEWPEVPDAAALADLIEHLYREPVWRNRVNVGLAHVAGPNEIRLHVHERGAGPTPACGSGAVAAAWALGRPLGSGSWRVHQPGGCLVIDLKPVAGRVVTEGLARLVFQGNIA